MSSYMFNSGVSKLICAGLHSKGLGFAGPGVSAAIFSSPVEAHKHPEAMCKPMGMTVFQ